MESIAAFKKSRLAMDPSTQKLTDHQWEQAYEAYKLSRKRVRESSRQSSETSGKDGSRRRRSRSTSSRSRSASHQRSHKFASMTKTALFKHRIQSDSAYQDLRLLIDVISYILMGLVAFSALSKIVAYSSMFSAASTLVDAIFQIILLLVGKWLINVLIDIPDILLFRELNSFEDAESAEATARHTDAVE
jgi:hypothetical protein